MLYGVIHLIIPQRKTLFSKFLIWPQLRLGLMFAFRKFFQSRACITAYNIVGKYFILKIHHMLWIPTFMQQVSATMNMLLQIYMSFYSEWHLSENKENIIIGKHFTCFLLHWVAMVTWILTVCLFKVEQNTNRNETTRKIFLRFKDSDNTFYQRTFKNWRRIWQR